MRSKSKQSIGVLFFSGFLILAFSGCSVNSEITREYVNPDIHKMDLHGVLVVGIAPEQAGRVRFEDEFTKALSQQGVQAQASHALVPQAKPTADDIITAAKNANIDTILVTRYAGESKEQVYHPGTVYYGVAPAYGSSYYGGFDGYYAHAYEVAYDQPVWTTNVTHTVVSDLYVTATREHLWQAVSETIQANSTEQVREDAINSLIGNLKSQGLIQ
jgi:hypothetical protein